MAYIASETGALSATTVTDTYAYLSLQASPQLGACRLWSPLDRR